MSVRIRVIPCLDVADGRVVQSLTGHTTVVHDLAWSPNGRHLAACAEDGTVRVWDVASGRTVPSSAHAAR